MQLILILALLGGCSPDKDKSNETGVVDTEDTLDSGDPPACTAEVLTVSPEDGDVETYYRDGLEVTFTEDGTLAEFRLLHRDTELAQTLSVTWGEGNLKAAVEPDLPLQPSSAYDFIVTVCEQEWSSGFTTTEYGTELEVDVDALVDTTSVLLFPDVNFVLPEGIGVLLGMYLDIPLLVGVQAVSGDSIDLLIAQGYLDSVEGFKQRVNIPTWSFSQADFSEKPWFSVATEEVNIRYSGIDIPVTDFRLEGTFSADGSHFSGGILTGLGDTRNMGVLFQGGSENEDYVCGTLAAPMGVECEVCPDGERFCLLLRGEDITTQAEPGLSLVAVEE